MLFKHLMFRVAFQAFSQTRRNETADAIQDRLLPRVLLPTRPRLAVVDLEILKVLEREALETLFAAIPTPPIIGTGKNPASVVGVAYAHAQMANSSM